MKKMIWVTILVLAINSAAFAEEKKPSAFKKTVHKIVYSTIKNGQPDPTKEIVKSNEQANIYYNANDVNKALEVLLAIPEEQRSAQDWLLIGNILQDQEKTTDAAFMYQRAIMINPDYYKSYYNLGNIYLGEEKPYMAIENFKKAAKLNPEFAYAYYNIGCAYLQAGNLKKAKLYFLKAISIKNTEPNFHYNLAYTYKKLNNQKLALRYYEFYEKILESKGAQN